MQLVSFIHILPECHTIIYRHATGGSIPGLLPRLSDAELNVTQSVNNTGNVKLSFMRSLVELGSNNISV